MVRFYTIAAAGGKEREKISRDERERFSSIRERDRQRIARLWRAIEFEGAGLGEKETP